jgi:hypothetical protein
LDCKLVGNWPGAPVGVLFGVSSEMIMVIVTIPGRVLPKGVYLRPQMCGFRQPCIGCRGNERKTLVTCMTAESTLETLGQNLMR